MFLLLALAGSVLNKLTDVINKPTSIVDYLAQTLPGQSTFFITLIMLMGLGAFPFELLRIGPLIVVALKRKFLNMTPREDKAAWRPPPIAYDVQVSYTLSIYALGFNHFIHERKVKREKGKENRKREREERERKKEKRKEKRKKRQRKRKRKRDKGKKKREKRKE